MGEAFWGAAVGTCIGLVAGALIQYAAQRIFVRWQASNALNALKQELQYNLIVADSLIDEARRLTAAVGSGSISSYFGFFRMGDVFNVMAIKCLSDGLLYKFLSASDLSKLQSASSFFSIGTAQWVGAQIAELKAGNGNSIQFATFLETSLRDNRQRLQEVYDALKKAK